MDVIKLKDRVGIFLTDEEVRKLCRPGAGADTCIWLTCGGDGFECIYYNRNVPNLLGEALEDRWRAGKTVAKRDGCEEARKLLFEATTPFERR